MHAGYPLKCKTEPSGQSEGKHEYRFTLEVLAHQPPPPCLIELRRLRVRARVQERLPVPNPSEACERRVEQRCPVTTPLYRLDHEQRPDVACLVVRAHETLHVLLVLRNQEDRLVHVPGDLCVSDERWVRQPVLRRAVADRVDARQVGACGGTKMRHDRQSSSGTRQVYRCKYQNICITTGLLMLQAFPDAKV